MTHPNQQQANAPAQGQPINRTTLLEAMMQIADMPFDRPAVDYLAPYGAQVRTAIQARDGESLSAYATRAVQGMLRNVQFKGHLTPAALREMLYQKGWQPLHDAIAGDRNALALIEKWAGNAQQPLRTGAPQEPAPPRDSASRAPAPARQERPQRDQQRPPGQGSAHHPLDERPPSRNESPGVRRHNADNVRQIASHPNHPAGQPSPGNAGNAATDEERRQGQKKVYGGKAALTFEVDNRRNGAPTIRVEAAKILNAEARTYDWKNKITIQLTTSELQKITALLLGLIKQAKFSNHGPKNDKWFEFSHQEDPKYAGTVKVAVGEAKEMCIVSITHEDIGDVTSLFLRQVAAAGGLDQAAVPAILRPVANAYNLAQAKYQGGGGQRQQRHG